MTHLFNDLLILIQSPCFLKASKGLSEDRHLKLY